MNINNLVALGAVSISDFFRKENSIYDSAVHLRKALEWLCLAQDSTKDGGVSEGYHLFHGWLPSYPETTGYIIETFFDYFHHTDTIDFRNRALRMADWLLSIQNDDGSIPDSYFKKKMVFDTGQVIFGFVKSYEETGKEKYKIAAEKAADWLLAVQEREGSWIRYAVDNIPHTYYSRVAWSLLRVHKITSKEQYIEGCVKNIEWCLKQQANSGWFNNSSFNLKNHHRPYTHTIAYTIRGILESGIYLNEDRYIMSARKALDGIIGCVSDGGFIPGTFSENWEGDGSFSCLTGNAQLAICFLTLYDRIKNPAYINIARTINNYLKGKQRIVNRNKNIDGAIAGSYPVWGSYIHFTYPNWAAKFFADSLILEMKLFHE